MGKRGYRDLNLSNDRKRSTAVVRKSSPDVAYWREAEAEVGAKPVRLCPCSSNVPLKGRNIKGLNFFSSLCYGLEPTRVTLSRH